MQDVVPPPFPETVGGAVDYAPLCRGTLQTARDQLKSIRDWMAAPQTDGAH